MKRKMLNVIFNNGKEKEYVFEKEEEMTWQEYQEAIIYIQELVEKMFKEYETGHLSFSTNGKTVILNVKSIAGVEIYDEQ